MTVPPEAGGILDLTRDVVAVIDENGVYRYLNATAADLLGFTPDSLVGRDATDLLHPADQQAVLAALADAECGIGDSGVPVEYRHRTATDTWQRLRGELYSPGSAAIDGAIACVRAAETKAETVGRLETIAACSPDVLWMVDADWSEVLFVNSSIESMFGLDTATIKSRPRQILRRVHPDDRQKVDAAMNRLSAGESVQVEYRIEQPDGDIRWLRVPAEPVIEDGEVVAIAGFIRDITDEYRRNRQLTVMDHLLRHTIRNEMNIVLGTAAQIANGHPETVQSEVDTIRNAAAGLLDTAEKQRDVINLLSREATPQPIPVEPAVTDAVQAARDMEPDSNFSVTCPAGVTALALPEFEDAIAELVENAVQHAETRPTVHVEVTVSETAVTVAVIDNCPPVPPAERHVIADKWEMDHLRHTVGMGLWLVYWVADRSGGRLTFDSHEDGNVVRLSVPVAHDYTVRAGVAVPDGDAATDGGRDDTS